VVLACGGLPLGDTSAEPGAAPQPPATVDAAAPASSPSVMVYTKGEPAGFHRAVLMDTTGFEVPMAALSMLVPAGWNVEGGITWAPRAGCTPEAVTHWLTTTSVDGAWSLSILPDVGWDWSTDAKLREWLNGGASGQRVACRVAPPLQLEEYVRTTLARDHGFEVVSVERHDPTLAEVQAEAARDVESSTQSGNHTMALSTALLVGVRFTGGGPGWLLVSMTVLTIDGSTAEGTPARFEFSHVKDAAVLRYPPGSDKDARILLETIVASDVVQGAWNTRKTQRLNVPLMER
jgi:hypothetical protein